MREGGGGGGGSGGDAEKIGNFVKVPSAEAVKYIHPPMQEKRGILRVGTLFRRIRKMWYRARNTSPIASACTACFLHLLVLNDKDIV